MTASAFLLKRLFLASLDFLSPFGLIEILVHTCHPEISFDSLSGFSFHFSLDFFDSFSIFLGFLFHLAEVYSQFYCCFAENILCRDINVLIWVLERYIIEISFPSKGENWCGSDYCPIEDNPFRFCKLSGFSLYLCYFVLSLIGNTTLKKSLTILMCHILDSFETWIKIYNMLVSVFWLCLFCHCKASLSVPGYPGQFLYFHNYFFGTFYFSNINPGSYWELGWDPGIWVFPKISEWINQHNLRINHL